METIIDEGTDLLQQARALYSAYPYGDFDYDRAAIYEKSLLYQRARRLSKKDTIYDIGCGQGFVLDFLSRRTPCQLVGIDLSKPALDRCRAKGLQVYEMNNLALSLADEVSDFTVSNGVIHHTPDPKQSFRELVRITKRGKEVYLSVYNRNFFYYPMYRMTRPLRALYRRSPRLVTRAIFPFFYFLFLIPVFWVVRRQTIGWATGLTWFADLFLTPQATFHTRGEIEAWIGESHCTLTEFSIEKKGAMLSFVMRKE